MTVRRVPVRLWHSIRVLEKRLPTTELLGSSVTRNYTRRTFLAAAAVPAIAARASKPSPYATPFKYGKLVLSASPDKAAFDSRSVDCPFVFQNDSLFYMTYIGWDGTGYQTGLASSSDLIEWRK